MGTYVALLHADDLAAHRSLNLHNNVSLVEEECESAPKKARSSEVEIEGCHLDEQHEKQLFISAECGMRSKRREVRTAASSREG